MPRPGSEWTTITISKKVYEMIRQAMTESNEEAGYRKYRSISHFAEHVFMNTYAREYDLASVFHFRLPSAEETTSTQVLEKVIKYEESKGRKPQDVSDEQLGLDIKSIDKKTREVRYIKVKSGRGGSVVFTRNEFEAANRLREKYFVYVVNDHITTIPNPAEVLSKEKNMRVILPFSSLDEKSKE